MTSADLDAMEKLVGPLIPKFKKLKKEAEKVDQELKAARQARERAFRLSQLEVKKRSEAQKVDREEKEWMARALTLLSSNLKKTETSQSTTMTASVRRLTNRSGVEYWQPDTHTYSFVPTDRGQPFSDLLQGVNVIPKRFSRYLVINLDNGKLSLVRFAKTRWTYFTQGVICGQRLKIDGSDWKVGIHFDWGTSTETLFRNGWVTLEGKGNHTRGLRLSSKIDFAFSVTGVELGKIEFMHANLPGHFISKLEIASNTEVLSQKLKEFIITRLTVPFKYTTNLAGEQATNYFGKSWPTTFKIQAHRVGDTAIFSASEYPQIKKQSPAI